MSQHVPGAGARIPLASWLVPAVLWPSGPGQWLTQRSFITQTILYDLLPITLMPKGAIPWDILKEEGSL